MFGESKILHIELAKSDILPCYCPFPIIFSYGERTAGVEYLFHSSFIQDDKSVFTHSCVPRQLLSPHRQTVFARSVRTPQLLHAPTKQLPPTIPKDSQPKPRPANMSLSPLTTHTASIVAITTSATQGGTSDHPQPHPRPNLCHSSPSPPAPPPPTPTATLPPGISLAPTFLAIPDIPLTPNIKPH